MNIVVIDPFPNEPCCSEGFGSVAMTDASSISNDKDNSESLVAQAGRPFDDTFHRSGGQRTLSQPLADDSLSCPTRSCWVGS